MHKQYIEDYFDYTERLKNISEAIKSEFIKRLKIQYPNLIEESIDYIFIGKEVININFSYKCNDGSYDFNHNYLTCNINDFKKLEPMYDLSWYEE